PPSFPTRRSSDLLLEQQLAPQLSGMTTIEILAKMKFAVNEVCAVFRDGTAGWLDAPPETKGASESDGAPIIECPPPPTPSSPMQSAAPGPLLSGEKSGNTAPG